MALVIEDGSGIAGATSFVTAEELQAYAALRSVVISDDEADGLGIVAMDYITTVAFGGEQLFELPFPRVGLILPNGDELAEDVVPAGMKKAQMQLALDAKNGVKLAISANPEPMLKREKTGPIENEWFAPADSGVNSLSPSLPIAAAAMAPFLASSQPFTLRTLRV